MPAIRRLALLSLVAVLLGAATGCHGRLFHRDDDSRYSNSECCDR
jgi:hypothetical protein